MAANPEEALLSSLPDSGDYSDFKEAVFCTLPAHPELARRIIENDLMDLGATDIKWINEPQRKTADNGKDYWFMLGEGVFEDQSKDAFNAFYKGVLRLGEKHFGWTPGLNPSFMGYCWVFNFTVAVRAI